MQFSQSEKLSVWRLDMALSREGLIAKLNATCRSGLEESARLCVARTHYEVDIEHYLLKLTEMSDADVAAIYRQFDIDASRVSRDLTRALDRMKSGNSRNPSISPRIVKLLSESWSVGSVEYNASQIRSAFILTALLASDSLSHFATTSCPELQKISIEQLRSGLLSICANSVEDLSGFMKEEGGAAAKGREPSNGSGASGKTNLDQYTINLTEAAKAGKIDPVLGRDFEVRQIIDILTRRRQNNPILTGEAGVGKTAVVEGFARRIASGDVPPSLRGVELRALDLGLLQAGAGIKGEFENRLKNVIAEVKASPAPIILFIDEAHTMIGAGGQAGQNDAANLLKPALARGELRTIAATTWSEYKKYFEKDAALARRFQVIKVEEPTEEQADVMLRGVKSTLEKHHKVTILDEAVTTAVRLSQRYISGRQLPDKAVSVLDTACARVSLAQNATPASLEDAQRQIESIETELGILERESAIGTDHAERLKTLLAAKDGAQTRATDLQARLTQERMIVQKMIELRGQIEQVVASPEAVSSVATMTGTGPVLVAYRPTAEPTAVDLEPLRLELANLATELATLQGENPLVKPYVDGGTIAEVIAGWTGIPVGKMLKDEIQTVLRLKSLLAERVVGQDHALQAISQRIHTARAGLDDPRRPVGVFLLVGPSGVGKTETALALADTLYGGERNLVTINMSEYQEAHSISGLKGSPPGYVGYGEGGVLTEAVRRKPYCVVLLDEMEKAHTDVMELFYQVFDKGFMEDAEGRDVDFKNTVIIMTSNTGSDLIMKVCADPETRPDPPALGEALNPELRKIFKPALLGRLIVVPYYPIDDQSLRRIIKLKLEQIGERLQENHRVPFTYSEELISEIVRRCTEVESGARNVDHILTGTLLPEVASEMLSRMVTSNALSRVYVTAEQGQGFRYDIA
jgi:type VI secretion system protein VasG